MKVDATVLSKDDMPTKIQLKGLDMKCQWYPYNAIREYVLINKQDLVCPLPERPVPSESTESDTDSEVSTPSHKCPCTGRGHGRV